MEHETAGQALARQTRETRERLGLGQRELADKLTALGWRCDQTTVAKIESGSRRVTVDEALQLAAALGVAPVNLLLRRDNEVMQVAPELSGSAGIFRRWFTGQEPLPDSDEAVFWREAPDETGVIFAPGVWHLLTTAHELANAARERDAETMLAALASLDRELGRQRDEVAAIKRRTKRS